MQVYTTSSGNNQTSIRYSGWQFTKSRRQWIFVITSPSNKVKKNSQDWKNCWKSFSMSSKSLCYLDTMAIPRISIIYSRILRYTNRMAVEEVCRFVSWMIHEGRKKFQCTSCTSRIWAISNIVSFIRVMWRNNNLARNAKCKFCDFFDHIPLSKTMKCRHIKISSTSVINTSCQVKKLICDSQINDSKCQHRSSCTLTSSQPLMTRTDTSPSC